MTTGKYILDKNRTPKAERDFMKWALWLEAATKDGRRVVKLEKIGKSEVSTVFLGLDHSWLGKEPVLWETMVFGGKLDQKQARCSGGWAEAEHMHKIMCARVRKAEKVKTVPKPRRGRG